MPVRAGRSYMPKHSSLQRPTVISEFPTEHHRKKKKMDSYQTIASFTGIERFKSS